MRIQELKKKRRIRRKAHIRKRISGTAERPRLTVFRSNLHIYAQIIDDVANKTVVSASSLEKDIMAQIKPEMNKTQQSVLVGTELAKKANSAGIKEVQFDRNGYPYHGRIKALADGARKGGLKF